MRQTHKNNLENLLISNKIDSQYIKMKNNKIHKLFFYHLWKINTLFLTNLQNILMNLKRITIKMIKNEYYIFILFIMILFFNSYFS